MRTPLEQSTWGLKSQLTSFDSGSVKILAGRGWTLHASLPGRALDSHVISSGNNPVLISSWEFVVTLDYEWSVIRRHRPFGWTIWVRIDASFLLGFIAQVRALYQSISFGRSTLPRAYPLLSL